MERRKVHSTRVEQVGGIHGLTVCVRVKRFAAIESETALLFLAGCLFLEAQVLLRLQLEEVAGSTMVASYVGIGF